MTYLTANDISEAHLTADNICKEALSLFHILPWPTSGNSKSNFIEFLSTTRSPNQFSVAFEISIADLQSSLHSFSTKFLLPAMELLYEKIPSSAWLADPGELEIPLGVAGAALATLNGTEMRCVIMSVPVDEPGPNRSYGKIYSVAKDELINSYCALIARFDIRIEAKA